jgi:hypothetical protein
VTSGPGPGPVRPPASPWPFVGMAGMACLFFLYAASGLLAPAWAVVVLLVLWALLLLVALAWWSLHPRWVPAIPVVGAVVWFAAMTAGGAWLGWTA